MVTGDDHEGREAVEAREGTKPYSSRWFMRWRDVNTWLFGPGRTVVIGTVTDVERHLQRLIEASPDGQFLIVELSENDEAFLQFRDSGTAIQLDHPLLTAQQLEREGSLKQAISVAGLTAYEVRGSDGSRFLDCDLPRDPVRAAAIIGTILRSVFEIDTVTRLRFVGEGLVPES